MKGEKAASVWRGAFECGTKGARLGRVAVLALCPDGDAVSSPTVQADAALIAAARQLATAVAEQEHAVTRILGLVELLIEHAPDAATRLRLEGIFEACGFQDLTGQRLVRVQRLLKHLANHVHDPVPAPPRNSMAAGVAPADEPSPPALSQQDVDRLLRGGSPTKRN